MIIKLLLFIITALITLYCVHWFGAKEVIIAYICAVVGLLLYYGIERLIKKEKESDLFPERHNRPKQ